MEQAVAVEAAHSLESHLTCAASASLLPAAQYFDDGLGAGTGSEAMTAATRARWLAAFSRFAPADDDWRCRGNVCFAGASDVAVVRELAGEAVHPESSIYWVLVFDGACVFDMRLLWAPTSSFDPLDVRNPGQGAGPSERLSVFVCPGADVFVDGHFVGLSPIDVQAAVGDRQVRVRYRIGPSPEGPHGTWELAETRHIEAGRPDGFSRYITRTPTACGCARGD